jgi:hypothetical protein
MKKMSKEERKAIIADEGNGILFFLMEEFDLHWACCTDEELREEAMAMGPDNNGYRPWLALVNIVFALEKKSIAEAAKCLCEANRLTQPFLVKNDFYEVLNPNYSRHWKLWRAKALARRGAMQIMMQIMNSEDMPPVVWAARSKSAYFMGIALEQSLDVNATYKGRSALHFAAMLNCPNIAKRLLAAGANATMRDSLGKSPLFYASSWGGEILKVVSGVN